MSFTAKDPKYEEKVRKSFTRQKFMALIGAEISGIRPGFCEIRLPYRAELSQHHGYFHAGVVGTIADNAGGFAAFSLMPAGSSVLTVEFKLNLIAPGDGEILIARGEVVRSGRTLTVCSTEVYVEQKGVSKLCATSLMTLIAVSGMHELA